MREEYTAEGQKKASYTYGANLISQQRDSTIAFYLNDGHSGVRQLSNRQGQVTDTYNYDAYGNLLQINGTTTNSYFYRGEQSDLNLGLQYLRARYYEPKLGRFLSTDPFDGMMDKPISLHRYAYANDNPVTFSDPSGLSSDLLEAAAGLAIAGILAATIQATPSYFAMREAEQRGNNNVRWFGNAYNVSSPILSRSTAPFPNIPWLSFLSFGVDISNNWGVRFVSTDFYPDYVNGGQVKQENSAMITLSPGFSAFAAVGANAAAPAGSFEVYTPPGLGPEMDRLPLSGGYIEAGGTLTSLPVSPFTIGYGKTALILGYGIGNGDGLSLGFNLQSPGRGTSLSFFLTSGISIMLFPNIVRKPSI